MLERRRGEFASLFGEFTGSYPATSEGVRHVALYDQGRIQARENLDSVLAAQEQGDDVTDLVLLKLLPYTDNARNREEGAWICVAPSVTGDLKGWFENVGWTKPADWPGVAQAILRFVVRCTENPGELDAACNEFRESPYSKGFQTGMLRPY